MQNDGEALEYALRAGRALENLLQKEAAAARKFKEALEELSGTIKDREIMGRLDAALVELLEKNDELQNILSHDLTKDKEFTKTPKFAQETDLEREIKKTKDKIKEFAQDKGKPFDLDKAMKRAELQCKLDKLLAQTMPHKPVPVKVKDEMVL